MRRLLQRFLWLVPVLLLAVAIGLHGQINATGGNTVGTNFGTAIATAVNVVSSVSGSAPTGAVVHVSINAVQTTLGVGCGAGTNTATPTLAWKGPGGTSETLAMTALSISANGTLDTNQNAAVDIAVQMGSAITFTTASTLASTGCTTTPQYTIYWRAI